MASEKVTSDGCHWGRSQTCPPWQKYEWRNYTPDCAMAHQNGTTVSSGVPVPVLSVLPLKVLDQESNSATKSQNQYLWCKV